MRQIERLLCGSQASPRKQRSGHLCIGCCFLDLIPEILTVLVKFGLCFALKIQAPIHFKGNRPVFSIQQLVVVVGKDEVNEGERFVLPL